MSRYRVTDFELNGEGSCSIVPRNHCNSDNYFRDIREIFYNLGWRWVSMAFCDKDGTHLRTYEGTVMSTPDGFFIVDTENSKRYGPVDRQIAEAKEPAGKFLEFGWHGYHHVELQVPDPKSIRKEPVRVPDEREFTDREFANRSADHFW